MTCKEVLPEKGLLGKVATIKRFDYSPLCSVLKKQTDLTKKQYHGFEKVYEFDGIISKDDQKPTSKKYNKSDVIYKTNQSFCKYQDTKKIEGLSFKSNYYFPTNFSNDLERFSKLEPQKEKTKEKKSNVHNTAS